MELAVTTTTTPENPDAGDLALDDAGSEVLLTTLADEVAQRLHVRLRFFRGEWFLNLLEGVPYYEEILTLGPTDEVIRGVFSSVISETEGVAALVSLNYSISNRVLTLAFEARLEDGTTFSTSDYPPFVV